MTQSDEQVKLNGRPLDEVKTSVLAAAKTHVRRVAWSRARPATSRAGSTTARWS